MKTLVMMSWGGEGGGGGGKWRAREGPMGGGNYIIKLTGFFFIRGMHYDRWDRMNRVEKGGIKGNLII